MPLSVQTEKAHWLGQVEPVSHSSRAGVTVLSSSAHLLSALRAEFGARSHLRPTASTELGILELGPTLRAELGVAGEGRLAFGHGSWAGTFAGERVVFAGNRDGTKNLVCHRVVSTNPFSMEEIVVDEGSGTTNMDVVDTPDGKALATSNAVHGEYALYFPA